MSKSKYSERRRLEIIAKKTLDELKNKKKKTKKEIDNPAYVIDKFGEKHEIK